MLAKQFYNSYYYIINFLKGHVGDCAGAWLYNYYNNIIVIVGIKLAEYLCFK